MRKKNLNFVLAALAALVLVFAAGCSDDPDDASGGYSYTSDYSGLTFTYDSELTEASHNASCSGGTYLKTVELAFGSSGSSVTVSVAYFSCGEASVSGQTAHGDSSKYYYTSYTASVTGATYTMLGDRVGIVLPGDSTTNADDVYLTFTYTAAANETPATLTLAGATDSASYTVAAGGDSTGTGIDLFTATTNAGGLAVGTSKFELEDEQ